MAVELTARRRAEQTRARYPDESGYVERDGVRVYYEVYGDAASRRSCSCRLVDRPLAALEDADPVPRPPLPRRHLRRPRQRPLRPPADRRPTTSRVRRGRARGAGRDRTRSAPSSSASRSAAQRGLLLAAEHPERVDGAVFIGPRFLGGGAPLAERTVYDFDDELDTDEGWAKYNAHYWLRDYPGFVEFFFVEGLHRAALDEADRGPRRLGARDRRRDADRDQDGAGLDAGGGARALPARSLPGARDPRRTGCDRAARARAPRSPSTPAATLVMLEGRRPLPRRPATRCTSTCSSASFARSRSTAMTRSSHGPREQTRARYPDEDGLVERDGVRVYWERLRRRRADDLPAPADVADLHSRPWKAQVPYLARHFRVVTFDPRGNGRSDRPTERRRVPSARSSPTTPSPCWTRPGRTARARRALSCGGRVALDPRGRAPGARRSAARRDRRRPSALAPDAARASRRIAVRRAELDDRRGLGEVQPPLLAARLPRLRRVLLRADVHRAALDEADRGLRRLGARDGRRDAAGQLTTAGDHAERARRSAPTSVARVRCPVLVIHGDRGRASSARASAARARAATGRRRSCTLEGAGHMPHARDPVLVNLLMREFVERRAAEPRRADAGRAALSRPQARAVHLVADRPRPRPARRRDRRRAAQAPSRPRDRLAGPAPGDRGARGARRADPSRERASSPASRRHIESESRRARPALLPGDPPDGRDPASRTSWSSTTSCATSDYDLWIGDEAWDVDHFLHENPELKRAAFAWLTDFVGWLPMPDGGEREAFLTADYNAEMIEHVERFPRMRDRAIFVGNPDDIVPDASGPGCRDPRLDRAALRVRRLRHRLRPGDARRPRGCAPSSATARRAGLHRDRRRLGRRRRTCCAASSTAFPAAKERVPDLRMIVVAGPRIDPADACPQPTGSRCARTCPTSTATSPRATSPSSRAGSRRRWSSTANRRPFLYFPLAPPLRAELPRAPPARPLRRRPLHGLRDRRPGRDRGRDRRGDRPRGRLPRRSRRTAPPGGRADRQSSSDHR